MLKNLLLRGRFLAVLLCCLISSMVVMAQTKYKGKVIGSDDKQPVVGASIRLIQSYRPLCRTKPYNNQKTNAILIIV